MVILLKMIFISNWLTQGSDQGKVIIPICIRRANGHIDRNQGKTMENQLSIRNKGGVNMQCIETK